jgi:hypothetical protein
MISSTIKEPIDDFIRVSGHLLNEGITIDALTEEEVAIVRMHIDMLGTKFFLTGRMSADIPVGRSAC